MCIFHFFFFWDDCGCKGWYDSPQSVLRFSY